MGTLETMFDNIENNKTSREAADKAALANGTITTGFGAPEESGLYFIPEGDQRLNDKINYNLSFIMDNAGSSKYKVIDFDTNAEVKDFLFVNTSKRVAQIDRITSVTVAQDFSYSVTLSGSTATYTSGIKQVSKIASFNAVNETLYRVTLDGSNADFTSGGNKEVKKVYNFAQVDDDVYTLTVDGQSVSYTSSDGDSESTIINDLTTKINNSSANVSATASASEIVITGNVSGTSFGLSINDGTMSRTTVTAASSATVSEIITGLKNKLNNLSKPVSITSNSSSITIVANVRGTSFSITESSANMSVSTPTPNHADSKSEIINGLKSQINNLNKPVTLSSDANTITFTADVSGNSFTLSSSSKLSNTNVVPNFNGSSTITLPSNPEDFSIISIFDYTNTFGSRGPKLKSDNKIMNSTSDMTLNVNNKLTRLISINNDWRIL